MERAQREGNVRLQKRTNAAKIALDSTLGNGVPVEENSFALEFKQTSSKKASGTPIKSLIGKEMSKEMETRQPSPSIVARLMGLDTLPPPVVSKEPKEMGSSCQKTSSVGFHEKYASYEGYSLQTSTNEYQEFKDVFEVMEMPKVEKYDKPPVRKGMSSLKQSEIDVALIRQKFMDAKRLSTDDAFQNSKEFSDALEVLDSNKVLFLKFLQEPNSLFERHRPSPHATGLVSHSLKEHTCSLPHKLSESLYAGKSKSCLHPTQIVVLKPSLEKALDTGRTVPSARSPENYHFGLRRHREISVPGTFEFYADGRDRQNLSDSVEVMGHKTKGLREIARETKKMRIPGSCGSKKVSTSKRYGYIRDEKSCGMSGMENLNSQLFRLTSDHLNDCNDTFSSSSYYSTESSVSTEARKHLSERWKTTRQFQEVVPVCRGFSTLGELISLSDRGKPTTTLNTTIIPNVSGEKVTRDEVLAKWDCPLGISSRDGWKDGWSRNLLRSKSLPALPLVYENRKPSTRNKVGGSASSYLKNVLLKSPIDPLDRNLRWRRCSSLKNFYHHTEAQFYSGREENQMSERQIYVNSEELRNSVHARYLGEEVCMIPELSNSSLAGSGHQAGDFSALQCNDAKFPLVIDDQQVLQPTELAVLAKDGDFSGHDQNVVTKETSVDHPQVNSFPSHCDISESSFVSSKEADQRSPVSVIEPPVSEEDKSTSGCFEKISPDLQGNECSLSFLSWSQQKHAEDLEVLISSDEENGEECHSLLKFGEILEAFRDNEDRDFSYLVDLLIDSGVYGAYRDGPFSAYHSSEYSVGLEVFGKLEKKYDVLVSWSRSERKLLFDIIKSVLADFVVPSIDLHPGMKSRSCQPTWAREGLVEEVWQMVVRRRKELSGNSEERLLEPMWLDLGDDVDMVGRELESMLNEELMEEVLLELVSE